MTIQAAYEAFLEDRQIYCSAGTLCTYRGHLKNFFVWIECKYNTPLVELHFEDILEKDNLLSGYVLELRRQNPDIRNTTIRSYCRVVKAFLRFCYEKDYCRDYIKGVKLPRDDAAPKQPLYQDEVEKIDSCFNPDTIKGMRDYCMVHLMLDCGMRCQEVRHLCVEHLQPERNIILIQDSKGRKSRFTLAPDFIFDAIRKYMGLCGRSSGTIFLGVRDRKPLTQNAIKQLFQNLKAQTGINRLHAHLLRHTFATSYLIGGGNLEFLRVFMGHYDYSVTQGYTQIAAQCKMLGADIYRLDQIFFTRGY